MEILGEEANSHSTSPRTHSWLLILALSLVSLHLFYLLTVVLYSGLQFLLVWNEIFRMQRPKALQTELVTQIYHHTLSVEVPSCPICLLDYSTYNSDDPNKLSTRRTMYVPHSRIPAHTDQGDVISHGRHCHHIFHNECLTLWLQKQPSCPCCRLAISEPPPGCTEEEMQEDDYVPDPAERIWVYIKWSMALCGMS